MNKNIAVIISIVCVIFVMTVSSFAETNIDFQNTQEVVIKYSLKEGSSRSMKVVNTNSEIFKSQVEKLLTRIFDNSNTQKIETINDIPIYKTEFSKYSIVQKPSDKSKNYTKDNSKKTNKSDKIVLSMKNRNVEILTKINGVSFIFENQPYIKDKIVYVPFRPIFEALGSNVTYESNPWYSIIQATKKVNGTETLVEVLIMGTERRAYKSKVGIIKFSTPPEIVQGTTFIPLQSLSKLIDAKVVWKESTKEIIITENSEK
jgi:hypothetical protein